MEPFTRVPEKDIDSSGDITRSISPSPQQQVRDAKAANILEACKWRDIERLRLLATDGEGLISDHLRRQACRCH